MNARDRLINAAWWLKRRRTSRPYTPASDSLSLLWWHAADAAPGAVASYSDRIAAVAATQATGAQQPIASATAISSAYPGITSNGTKLLVASGAGAVLSGRTTLTVVAAMVDSTASNTIALEHTTAYDSQNGGFAITVNTVAGSVDGAVRGTSSYTFRYASGDTLASPRVVSIGYSFSTAGAGAVAFIRINGVAQSLTNFAASSAAGSCANASLHFFARSGVVVPWAGTFGDIVFRNSVAQDAGLAALETYVGAQAGLTI